MPAKKTAPKGAPKDWRVRVRMHRQGVGDCFLVTFRTGGKSVHMLIDCGVLPGSPAEYNQLEAVKAAVRDEIEAEGGRIDVLVVTHEHADHVSGFDPASRSVSIMDGIPVGELWMAWTEDPDDRLAQRLNGQLAIHAMAAAAGLPRLKEVARRSDDRRFGVRVSRSVEDIEDILGNHGVLSDGGATVSGGQRRGKIAAGPFGATLSTTVRAAMDHIKARVPAKNFRKLRPGGKVQVLPCVSEKEIRVFILGPPRIENLDKSPRHGPNDDIFHLAAGDLRAQASSLIAAINAQAGKNADSLGSQPFAEGTGVRGSKPTMAALRALQKSYREETWRGVDEDWLLVAGEFAMQLDSATNNTSLVLAIELVATGEVLLFPGDAQVENWQTWRDLKWRVENAAGVSVEIRGEDLLRRTVFYKVGHHGSHNGTLDAHGLQLMPSAGLVAMCPVVHAVTSKRKGDWKQIPKLSLCTALQNKCGDGFLRMDAPAGTLAGRLDGCVQETALWVDYYLV